MITLSARASGGHRFVRLDPPSSCFISISSSLAKEIKTRSGKLHAHAKLKAVFAAFVRY